MGDRGFSRLSPWLREFFTPSEGIPPDPSKVSRDVSLIHPYDGSGWPLQNSSEWGVSATSAAGAAVTTNILTIGEDEICRLLAVGFNNTAGAFPTVNFRVNFIAGGVAFVCPITDRFTVGDLLFQSMPIRTPIIGPGHIIQGNHDGGNAGTIMQYHLYLVRAPLGSIYYV